MNDINLPYSASAERNRQPILDVLNGLLTENGEVLEIGSGTGQHAVYFSQNLSGITWQPSDRAQNLQILKAQFAQHSNASLKPVIALNVLESEWPDTRFVAVYSANTAHIMPWKAVEAMFQGVSACLRPAGLFCLYGPFNINGQFTSDSNQQFDGRLRSENALMGIRDLEAIETLASRHQLILEQRITMPANNFILVFRKDDH